jgi:hypothetical protein
MFTDKERVLLMHLLHAEKLRMEDENQEVYAQETQALMDKINVNPQVKHGERVEARQRQ